MYAWSCSLLGLFFLSTYRRLHPGAFSRLSPHERLLAVWPLVYLAVFVVFRNINSIRYYIIPSFLMLASLAPPLARVDWRAHRKIAAAYLCIAVGLNFCFWRELAAPRGRRPIVFRIGWHLERSSDFLPKDPLVQAMDKERVCNFPEHTSFIDKPLMFYRYGHPVLCDNTKSMTTRYCLDCPTPPYFAWDIKTNPTSH